MTNDEQVSLYEAVRDGFDVDGVRTDVKDQMLCFSCLRSTRKQQPTLTNLCLGGELYHHVKDCKKRAERKARKC